MSDTTAEERKLTAKQIAGRCQWIRCSYKKPPKDEKVHVLNHVGLQVNNVEYLEQDKTGYKFYVSPGDVVYAEYWMPKPQKPKKYRQRGLDQ